jgi:hypothetical protein
MVRRHAVECNDGAYAESLSRHQPSNSDSAMEQIFVTGGPSVAPRGSDYWR